MCFFANDEYLTFSEDYLMQIINDSELSDYSLDFKRYINYKKLGIKSKEYKEPDSILKMTEIFKSFDINYYSKSIFLKNSKDENVKIEKENDLYNLK